MHGIYFVKSFKSVENLFQKGSGLILSESLLVVEILLQIAPIAVLDDDEDCGLSCETIHESYYILILALLEHFYFGLHQLFQLRRLFHEDLRDSLDGHPASISLVNRLINHRPCTIA